MDSFCLNLFSLYILKDMEKKARIKENENSKDNN